MGREPAFPSQASGEIGVGRYERNTPIFGRGGDDRNHRFMQRLDRGKWARIPCRSCDPRRMFERETDGSGKCLDVQCIDLREIHTRVLCRAAPGVPYALPGWAFAYAATALPTASLSEFAVAVCSESLAPQQV